MKRQCLFQVFCVITCACLGLAQESQAHFVWLDSVKEDGITKGVLYFSESAYQQDYRLPDRIAEAIVWEKFKDKQLQKLKMSKVKTESRIGLEGTLDKKDSAVLAATCNYGIYGGSLLSYYTKHIRSSSLNELNGAGHVKELKLEIVPRAMEGRVELTVLWKGEPREGVEVEVSESEEESHSLTTDAQGRTHYRPTIAGLVGVRAGFIDKETKGRSMSVQHIMRL